VVDELDEASVRAAGRFGRVGAEDNVWGSEVFEDMVCMGGSGWGALGDAELWTGGIFSATLVVGNGTSTC